MKDARMAGSGQGVARRSRVRLGAQGGPVCDLLTATGSAAVAAPVPVGGGTSSSFSYFPPAEDSAALVGRTEGAFPQMVPLSSQAWPAQLGAEASFVSDPPEAAADEDHPKKWTPKEPVLVHNGVAVHITEDGQLVVHGAGPVRVQLASGTYLRVSLQGEATEEHLVLAGPMMDAHNALVDKVASLVDRLATVEQALNELLAGVSAPSTVPAAAAKSTTTMATIAIPFTKPSTTEEDDVSSAAFVVSSATVASAATSLQG